MNEFEILSPQTLKFNYLAILDHNGPPRISPTCSHREISTYVYDTQVIVEDYFLYDYHLSGIFTNKTGISLILGNVLDKIYE